MMDFWRDALWQQFGAAIDMLDDAVLHCPESLWTEPLWIDDALPPAAAAFPQFWSITHHVLFWLDLYLYGTLEGFAPPAPFTLCELDPAGAVPDSPYTKDVLRDYLLSLRTRCQTIVTGLTEEQAGRPCGFPGSRWKSVSYYELQLYNMRHVQEHGAQLHLFLGQHAIKTENGWIARATDAQGGA